MQRSVGQPTALKWLDMARDTVKTINFKQKLVRNKINMHNLKFIWAIYSKSLENKWKWINKSTSKFLWVGINWAQQSIKGDFRSKWRRACNTVVSENWTVFNIWPFFNISDYWRVKWILVYLNFPLEFEIQCSNRLYIFLH